MKNIIVGTAGHVDHGKTSLIKALTGTDTDRLKEEKKRGITIELGFASMPNDRGLNIGIIDVPGHEKFIRNMLSGIGSVDLALLIIAADEGIMPQTQEHFQILKRLNIEKGIIVLTKIDLVEPEWIEIVKEEIEELTKDSFMEKAKIIEVSSVSGVNIELLKKEIYAVAMEISSKDETLENFRMPIDRVFSASGFGTVVTGTLIEGSCKLGEEVELHPLGESIKIRGIQVHGQEKQEAVAGQRVAINLANTKKDDVKRGYVLGAKDSLFQSQMINVKFQMFPKTKRKISTGARLHLYYGSGEVTCKAVILNKEILSQGEEAYIQLRLEKPISVKKGDRYILGLYSPIETIGGGEIIEIEARKHKAFDDKVLSALVIKENGTNEEIIEQTILEESKKLTSITKILKKVNINKIDGRANIKILLKKGSVINIGEDIAIHKDFIEFIGEKTGEILNEYHEKNPISMGMMKEEFKNKISIYIENKIEKVNELIIEQLKEKNYIKEESRKISNFKFNVQYTKEQEEIKEKIVEKCKKEKFNFSPLDDYFQLHDDKKLVIQLIDALAKSGEIIKLANKQIVSIETWKEGIEIIERYFKEKGSITLGEFRDETNSSRKYAVALLETFDKEKITILAGERRIPY